MAAHCHQRRLPADTMVMMEHQASQSVAIIMRGSVKICLCRDERETFLNICGPGEVLGELHWIDGLGHSADILTLEESHFLWIDKDALSSALQTHPRLAMNLFSVLTRRLRLATGRIEALTTLDVPGRVAHQLLNFGKEYGVAQPDGSVMIPLFLTQGDLAALTGATRTRVNQVLMGMRREQLIEIGKNHYFTLLSPATLGRRYLGPQQSLSSQQR